MGRARGGNKRRVYACLLHIYTRFIPPAPTTPCAQVSVLRKPSTQPFPIPRSQASNLHAPTLAGGFAPFLSDKWGLRPPAPHTLQRGRCLSCSLLKPTGGCYTPLSVGTGALYTFSLSKNHQSPAPSFPPSLPRLR